MIRYTIRFMMKQLVCPSLPALLYSSAYNWRNVLERHSGILLYLISTSSCILWEYTSSIEEEYEKYTNPSRVSSPKIAIQVK